MWKKRVWLFRTTVQFKDLGEIPVETPVSSNFWKMKEHGFAKAIKFGLLLFARICPLQI